MVEADRNENFILSEAISMLEATPTVFRALLEGLPDSMLEYQENPEAWNPRIVVLQYIHNELENWMLRVRVILSHLKSADFRPSYKCLS